MLRFVSPTRREFLRLGGLLGLTMPACASGARDRQHPGFGKARSVLLVFASGGQSQIDTWDPKPDAPEDVRGAFRSIRSAVPGTLLCEHLPRLARLADRYTIVRSATHDDVDHGSAAYA